MWFYASYRNWGAETLPAGTYRNANPDGYTFVPDLSQPVHNPLWQISWDGRVTWQVSSKNKIAVYGANEDRCWCGDLASATVSYEASNQFRTPASYFVMTTWTWPASQRLFVEVGVAHRAEHWTLSSAARHSAKSLIDPRPGHGDRFAAQNQNIFQEQLRSRGTVEPR